MAGQSSDPKRRRIAVLAGVAALLALILGWVFLQDTFFRMSVAPSGHFADAKPPAAPDLANPASWATRPGEPQPGGWETPWGVDVFFIHPGSNGSAGWNMPIDNADALGRLKQVILPNHAAPFRQAGPIYAPLYREASLHAEINVGTESDGAFLLAYDDVLHTFDRYMSADNRGRGIVLVGVGQGGLYAQRLLADRFQQSPQKDRLAAAYIIDAALPADFPGKIVSQPLCATSDAIHCIAGWSTGGDTGDRFRNQSPMWTADWKITTSQGHTLACTNPISWTTTTDTAPSNKHLGGARAHGPAVPRIIPAAVSAHCGADGLLGTTPPSAPDLQSDGAAGARYRAPPFNLFYADIAANAAARSQALTAWLENPANARRPAPPLDAPVALIDAPIHRPTGQPERPN